MSRWWDTTVSDASNALYSDPNLALTAATVPVDLTQTQADYKQDQEQARQDQGGFFGTLAKGLGKVDSWASNIPGWGIAKNVVWEPIDKASSGMYWLYSNAVSQPISTLLLLGGKGDVNDNFWSTVTSGKEWGDAYHAAEHISPGQAFINYENTVEAADQGTLLSWFFGDAGSEISDAEKAKVKQSTDRFLYDTEYWRDKGGWKYTVGSGSIDFMFNLLDPVGGAVVGGAAKTIKGARSVEFAPQVLKTGEATAEGVGRTRGPLVDLFARQQTPAEAAQLPKLQDSFNWMKAEGRTTEEIANHPMWGRGRRVNPARYDLAKLIKDTPRENIEQVWRFAVGDATAGRELAEQAPELLKKVGQLADNRVLIGGAKINPSIIAAFKAEAEQADVPRDPNLLIEPPFARPTTPGPRQSGWDATWGDLARTAQVNRMAANAIAEDNPLKIIGPAENLTFADALKGEQWRAGKLTTMADDYDELINKEKYLGGLLGTMDNWTPAMSPLFGTLGRSYRSGGLAVRNTENAALQATIRSAGRKPKAVGGNFVMTTIKRGMGAPMTIVHAFGERTPEGFVNHNSDDARDRVFAMLKSVKDLKPEQRLDLIEQYNLANGKVERSDALKKIHDTVLNHILVKNEGMDPELATVLREAIKDGIADKLGALKGGGIKSQRFGPAAENPEDIQKLTGQTPDTFDGPTPVRSDRLALEEDGNGFILSPLAVTQLDQSDILLPIKEIQRLVSRSSGSMKAARQAGGKAYDAVIKNLDSFDNLWKAATLLRPGFIPRMVSDEVLARMWKFGGMATLMDGAKGMGHFLENRSRQVMAITGKGSYVPATGKGIASNRAIVSLDDEGIIQAAKANDLPVNRIKVPPTLKMAYSRITDENNLIADTQKELALAERAAKKGGDEAPSPEYIASLRDRIAGSQAAINEYHDYVGEILRVAQDSVGRRLGDADFSYRIGKTTYRVPQAFSDEWDNPIPRSQITSEGAWKALFSRGEMIDRQRFWSHAEKTGSYKLIDPDQPNHMESWLDAINKQMRQDPFHRLIASGKTDKEALAWLNTTAEGRAYMSKMGYWNQEKEQFVRSVRYMMNKYVNEPALQQKLANNEIITEADLRKAFTRDEFPVVHGEEVKELSKLGIRETASHYRHEYLEKAWKMVADVPADILSRHPTYLQLHQSEMQNLIRQQYHYKTTNFGDDTITPKEWEAMNQKADKLARAKLRQVVYDPINTNGAAGLRFIYPFFKPYIDGLDRWAGLVAERPEQIGKLSKIYNAPVAANLVTDSSGNSVGTDGNADVPDTEAILAEQERLGRALTPEERSKFTKKQHVPLKDRILHLKAPWAKPGGKEYGAIRMQSLNTILPGDPWFDPGTGPIVQVAGNQLAKSSPSMGEFLQWSKILPYGPNQSTADLLTPKYIKSVYDAYVGQDVNNEKYQKAWLDVYNMKTAQYYEQMRQGKHVDPPKFEDIGKEAKNFLWLQAFTDWSSPASVKLSPLTGTPYQFFADQYQALLKADPQNAKDRFLATFGEDYAGFTNALTKSMGIAASIPADKQAEKYKELIAEDPDMAPLVIGDVYNGGPFSPSVYNKQLGQEIGGERVRERITAQESVNLGREQEGWREYMGAMNALDSQLIRSGFRSYTESGAEVFAQAKQSITAQIQEKNPAWAKAFGTTDRNAVPNRIRFMEKLVTDPRLMNDPLRKDIHTLRAYLLVRNNFKQQLAARGLQQLSYDQAGQPAGEAPDIGLAWRNYQMLFKNSSVGFGNLFNRYLANDDLQ